MEKERPYINFRKETFCSGKEDKGSKLSKSKAKYQLYALPGNGNQSQKPYFVALPAAQEVTLKFISSLDFYSRIA